MMMVSSSAVRLAPAELGNDVGCQWPHARSNPLPEHHGLAGTRAAHVPYRDSKLTRLLQDALGAAAATPSSSSAAPPAPAAHRSGFELERYSETFTDFLAGFKPAGMCYLRLTVQLHSRHQVKVCMMTTHSTADGKFLTPLHTAGNTADTAVRGTGARHRKHHAGEHISTTAPSLGLSTRPSAHMAAQLSQRTLSACCLRNQACLEAHRTPSTGCLAGHQRRACAPRPLGGYCQEAAGAGRSP